MRDIRLVKRGFLSNQLSKKEAFRLKESILLSQATRAAQRVIWGCVIITNRDASRFLALVSTRITRAFIEIRTPTLTYPETGSLRYVSSQLQTIPLLRFLNLIPPTLRRLPAPNLPPGLLLQKLLSRLGPVMMQAPPLPRDRVPVTRLGNDVTVLADLDGAVLQDGDAVAVPHCAEEGRADEGLDFEVVVVRIVDDAAVKRFAGTGWWAGE